MALHDFKSQRLFVDRDLSPGSAFELTREQSNYLLNVLRMSDGDQVLVFNGRDGEWLSEIEMLGRKKCALQPVRQTRSQPEPASLTYCFAPLKQARMDYMIQKAVEMGVGVLQPVLTQYTQVRKLKDERLRANAIEAAEQCGILTIPEIRQPIALKDLMKHLPDEADLIFCDEDRHSANPTGNLAALNGNGLALLIGPEGGFSDDERDFLNNLPRVTVLGLGPRILRADTAAVAALAILQANLGDWYN